MDEERNIEFIGEKIMKKQYDNSKFREARIKVGLTQEQLADLLTEKKHTTSKELVSLFETGRLRWNDSKRQAIRVILRMDENKTLIAPEDDRLSAIEHKIKELEKRINNLEVSTKN